MKTLNSIVFHVLLVCLFSTPLQLLPQEKNDMFFATMETRDAQSLKIEHPNEIQIIRSSNGLSAVKLSSSAAEELHHKILTHGPGFIYEPSRESALANLSLKNRAAFQGRNLARKFSISQETLVRQSLDLVNNNNIASQIQELEAYGSRYHTTNSARQSVLDLKTRWENMASGRSDVSVRIVNHTSTNMPSVVMTITGSENPDEYVIIGGHIDSTASGGNSNNAPGADDNASGIATITEAARVLFEMNFVPKRTIEFMAYAAEEVGLRGSREIAEDYKNRNVDVRAYLQLDMTNYKGSSEDIYISTDTFNDDDLNNFLIELINFYNASGTHKLTYATTQCNYGCSDHYSWAQQGYDVAFPFEASFRESNPHIHTTRDTFDRSPTPNATHAAKFAKLALEYLIEISNDNSNTDPGGEGCTQTINSFPYNASFESSFESWTQSTNDNLDFSRNSGGTPSNNTGPASAADGSYYLYVEASGNGSGFPNKNAILNSPCFNLSSLSQPELTFQYHMFGTAINQLIVEAKNSSETVWNQVFSQSGDQGNSWLTATIDLNNYTNQTEVQLRFSITTGSGNSGWQSDIAIDAVAIQNGSTDPTPTCSALNFNDFTISSFSNQDSDGTSSVGNNGASLTLTNNTWKHVLFNYDVTPNTVVEFEFNSSSEGEIHAIGFENDNNLSANRYFKVHGTQNYGTTNYDTYTNGTQTFTIPVGSFYTGTMDRLVFINDNDAGSGNNSTFSNVKIYEGSCNGTITAKSSTKLIPIIGNQPEGILPNTVISPNPTSDYINITIKNNNNNALVTINLYDSNGKLLLKKTSTENGKNHISLEKLSLSNGLYFVKITTQGEGSLTEKILIK